MTREPITLWPQEIRLSKGKDTLFVKFDNGYETTLSAELLRVESPSAEVQGGRDENHFAGKASVTISAPSQLAITPSGSALVMAMIPALAGIFYMIMVSANNNCWLIMQNGWRLWAAAVIDLVLAISKLARARTPPRAID